MLPSSSSYSSSSAVVRVDKATSHLLIGPDWTINMQICDSINANQWQAKDVVKAVKKKLQHKSSTVQFLTLTLLETMVKNCGDSVHFQIVERNVLQDMVKMVKKKADTKVRTKILGLLDSWKEAFGGPGGKYPQYFWTYEELRRSGVQFPKRSPDTVPIITPPATHPPAKPTSSSSLPSSGSKRLDEAMASEMESLSLSGLDAMGRVANLLTDMLRAIDPSDLEAVKNEVIVDLADQCRSNQKRLMQMLTSTGDEELLCRGLDLNDNLQNVLAKHDAIASGVPLPTTIDKSSQQNDGGASSIQDTSKETEPVAPISNAIVSVGPASSSQVDDVDEEDDDFAQLARRHTKHQSSLTGSSENLLSISTMHESCQGELVSSPNNALVLADPQPPTRITKEQDMIDFLSLALTVTSVESPAPPALESSPVSPTTQVHPNGCQTYPGQAGYNNYVAPWAQPQLQPQTHPQQFRRQGSFQQQNGVSPGIQYQPFQPGQSHFQQQQYVPFQPSQQQGSPLQGSSPLQPHTYYTQNVASQQMSFQQQQMSPHSSPQYPQYSQNVGSQQVTFQQQQMPPPSSPQYLHNVGSQGMPFQQQKMSPPSSPQYPHNVGSQGMPFQQQKMSPPSSPQYPQNLGSQRMPFQQQQMSPPSPQYSPTYIPPPWAATPGYYSNQRPLISSNTPQNYGSPSYTPTLANRPHQYNTGTNMQNDPLMNFAPMTSAPSAMQKPFIPSNRLFEDLDVFKQTDGRAKDSSNSGSPSLAGGSGQGMIGGNKW